MNKKLKSDLAILTKEFVIEIMILEKERRGSKRIEPNFENFICWLNNDFHYIY